MEKIILGSSLRIVHSGGSHRGCGSTLNRVLSSHRHLVPSLEHSAWRNAEGQISALAVNCGLLLFYDPWESDVSFSLVVTWVCFFDMTQT